MIILDFETNSANIHDVIEIASFRVEKVNNEYKVLDTSHRYYFSEYEYKLKKGVLIGVR